MREEVIKFYNFWKHKFQSQSKSLDLVCDVVIENGSAWRELRGTYRFTVSAAGIQINALQSSLWFNIREPLLTVVTFNYLEMTNALQINIPNLTTAKFYPIRQII